MAFKMPRLGYLTYAELKERWSCTDNQLRTAIICGDIVPAVFVDGVLMIPEWRNDNFRGWIADKPAEVKEGVAMGFGYAGLLFLQLPKRLGAWDCEYRLGSNIERPTVPNAPLDEKNNWYLAPKVFTMAEVVNEAVFLQSEIRAFESLYSAKSDPEQAPKIEKPLSDRERRTFNNIIHGLSLYLDSQSLSNAKAIKWLADNGYKDFEGLSKSTMELKFAEAKRSFSQQ